MQSLFGKLHASSWPTSNLDTTDFYPNVNVNIVAGGTGKEVEEVGKV
jgi:hypothetical protein